MQGYNAQIVVNENQIVVATEISASSPDFGHLEPMLKAANEPADRRHVSPTASSGSRASP